jgi:hypothetical protein
LTVKSSSRNLSTQQRQNLFLCEGISGTIVDLEIDATYQEQEIDVPINALVLDLARIDDEGGDSEAQS